MKYNMVICGPVIFTVFFPENPFHTAIDSMKRYLKPPRFFMHSMSLPLCE